ncbi:lactonase family protein [Leifsonia lichenia]
MTRQLLIGTYTEILPHVSGRARGILQAEFDDTTVRDARVVAELANPSWVTATADGSRVYAVSETEPEGAIVALAARGGAAGGGAAGGDAAGVLVELSSESSGGAAPAHLALEPSERFLATGTYGGGSISVFALADDGSLAARTAFVQHEGSGPDADRQESPHVHQLSFDPSTGDLVVVDLGLGDVRWYAFGDDGSLTLRPEATIVLGAAGPRHIVFAPDARHAFVVNELDSTVDVLRRDAGRFVVASSTSTRPEDASGANSPAAVRVTDDGRTVFVTNRGDDTIAVFAFDQPSATLTLVDAVPTQGRTPRDLVVAPGGSRVLTANQDSGDVSVFAFDPETRALTHLSTAPVPTPVSLHFL